MLPSALHYRDENLVNSALAHMSLANAQRIMLKLGCSVSSSSYIEGGQTFHNGFYKGENRHPNLAIGDECYIGRNCCFDVTSPIILEKNITLGMHVSILTHFDAGHSYIAADYPKTFAGVQIDEGAYVGASTLLLPGVHIGKGALIAAGSVVTTSIPAGMMAAGVPAKVLKPIQNGD